MAQGITTVENLTEGHRGMKYKVLTAWVGVLDTRPENIG